MWQIHVHAGFHTKHPKIWLNCPSTVVIWNSPEDELQYMRVIFFGPSNKRKGTRSHKHKVDGKNKLIYPNNFLDCFVWQMPFVLFWTDEIWLWVHWLQKPLEEVSKEKSCFPVSYQGLLATQGCRSHVYMSEQPSFLATGEKTGTGHLADGFRWVHVGPLGSLCIRTFVWGNCVHVQRIKCQLLLFLYIRGQIQMGWVENCLPRETPDENAREKKSCAL